MRWLAAASIAVVVLVITLAKGEDNATTQPSKSPLTYSLGGDSKEWDADARQRIVDAMNAAVALYNSNGTFKKSVRANYSPGTPTADGNYNGNIRFGGQISVRAALHEIAHTLGVGQHRRWREFINDGKWTGEHAIRQLQEFDGPDAVLHADKMHFWPYGLNYDREASADAFIRHVKMVAALRRDMGIED